MNLNEILTNPIEKEYFEGLLAKRNSSPINLSIHTDDNKSGIYPVAIAPQKLMESLPWRSYEEVKEKFGSTVKSSANLWLKKMHGGIGSSIKRDDYLKEFGRSNLGAKGTDLYIQTSNGPISIAEAQIIQASKKTSSFNKIIFQDVLNHEVVSLFDNIWKKYSDLGIERFNTLVQSSVPTLDSDDNLTLERRAPAGHGLFGYEILNAIFDKDLRPDADNLICCIGNGEDLSSTPDRSVANWMLEERIPICMVTTTKTKIDIKGGQISLWDKGEEGTYLTIIEKAQAESADQLDLFSSIGLREEDNEAFFNTNLVLLNIDVLVEMFKDANKEELLKNSLPDLILNKKEQDGKTYTQLEGAMGSVFLNLDTYWRKTTGKPLVHIMNVSKKNRTRFFSPIKSAFDYFMQYHSDRFTFNEETYHLENNNPGALPKVSLPSEYKDVSKVLEDFKDAKIINLEKLSLDKAENHSGKTLV